MTSQSPTPEGIKFAAARVASPDDLLTLLASVRPECRADHLAKYGTKMLRAAADLCGVDSVDMGRRAAISAILDNF